MQKELPREKLLCCCILVCDELLFLLVSSWPRIQRGLVDISVLSHPQKHKHLPIKLMAVNCPLSAPLQDPQTSQWSTGAFALRWSTQIIYSANPHQPQQNPSVLQDCLNTLPIRSMRSGMLGTLTVNQLPCLTLDMKIQRAISREKTSNIPWHNRVRTSSLQHPTTEKAEIQTQVPLLLSPLQSWTALE